MRFSAGLLIASCLVVAIPAQAGCPPVPKDFSLPSERHTPVDLINALERPWQAGGEIVLTCGSEGQPRVGRLASSPKNKAIELAIRQEHFALAKRINLAKKGEVNSRTLPLNEKQLALLERFALSDAGAVWFREVADDSLRLLNAGFLEYDRALWKKAVQQGHMPRLSDLLTGHLSEAGQFQADLQLFKFGAYAGPGAMAQPSGIGIGEAGMRCHFPSSDELVDPLAILSHEFGHTRYGDPSSGGDFVGEARTVALYENPVRIRNGYTPRSVYFQRNDQGLLEAKNGRLLDRLKLIEKERGIQVENLGSLDRYHCDCPEPLPILLDCEVRQPPLGETQENPTTNCTLRWKPRAPVQP